PPFDSLKGSILLMLEHVHAVFVPCIEHLLVPEGHVVPRWWHLGLCSFALLPHESLVLLQLLNEVRLRVDERQSLEAMQLSAADVPSELDVLRSNAVETVGDLSCQNCRNRSIEHTHVTNVGRS